MRHELQAKYPQHADKVKFYVGDVRDPHSIADVMLGVDYIFHAAALKQVPSCEFFPMQAVQTNIIGTRNGEKLYETLMTREERLRSEEMGHYFRVAADNRELNYDKFFVQGRNSRRID